MLLPANVGTKDFAQTKAPEGTTTGVVAGGAIGGTGAHDVASAGESGADFAEGD